MCADLNLTVDIKSPITLDVICLSYINTDADVELASIVTKSVTLISSIDLEQ